MLDATSSYKDNNDTTSLDENTTDYYTRKEKIQRDDMCSDTISDDDMWDLSLIHI